MPLRPIEEEEWVVTKGWALSRNALRRRMLMLESLLPFTPEPHPEAVHVVTTCQRHVRGHMARSSALRARRCRSQMRHVFQTWRIASDVMRVVVDIAKKALLDYSASVIQRAYRNHVAHWTRPRVIDLLKRVRDLERRLGSRKKKKRGDEAKKCLPPYK